MSNDQRYTITEMVNILAPDTGEDQKSLLHRQIRNLHKKGFLPETAIKDDRGTLEFDLAALYRFRIWWALILAGLDTDSKVFTEVQNAMKRMDATKPAPSQKRGGALFSQGGLRDAMRGIASGEKWILSMATRTVSLAHFQDCLARIHWDGDPEQRGALEGVGYRTVFAASIDLNVIFHGLPLMDCGDAY